VKTRVARTDDSVSFIMWPYRLVMAGFFVFAALMFVEMALIANVGGVALLPEYLGAIACVGLATRAGQAGRIDIGPDGVTIRALQRTRRLPWARIHEVRVVAGTSMLRSDVRVPYFDLGKGKGVRADEVRSMKPHSVVDEVVAECNRRLPPLTDRLRPSA
jgi:Bacterial PH domain